MHLEHMKKAIAAGWMLGLGAVALSYNVSSVTAWTFLVGLGLLPPLMLLRLWRQPAPTMSESIRAVTK
jgi:hypothetical protein